MPHDRNFYWVGLLVVTTVTHLQVHSTYTLLGATASVRALVAQAAQEEMTHLALTDTNVLYGAVAFSQACQRAALQPILGMVLSVRLPTALDEGGVPDQLVLLATGATGYRSLCRLSSALQAHPDREAQVKAGLAWETLKAERAGLICITGGRRSQLEQWLRADQGKAAGIYLGHLAGLFDEQLYLALELHTPADQVIARQVTTLGRRFGLPTVAVQPIFCLHAEERDRLRLLAAIDHNCLLADVSDTMLPDGNDPTVDLHWPNAATMAERFAPFPTALATTQTIAAQCQPALPDGRPLWPVLKLPTGVTPAGQLTTLATTRAARHYGDPLPAPIQARLAQELAIITQAGYAPLFLLVADLVRFARGQGIPVSTRGSVANSLVAYSVGITTVDPIEHDLLFERFLNPERANPPDIDLDFCSLRRDEVIDYVRQTYGEDRVAMVATISTMQPRSAVGETAKAYGLAEAETKALTKLLPDHWHPDPRRRHQSSLDTLLEKVTEPHHREVVQAAYAIIGQPHHLSIHPGGLVVTPGPLTDVTPVQWTPKGLLITQFAHSEVEAIGLPKIDLLGIRALTVLAATTTLVRRHYDPDFQLEAIPLVEAATAHLLRTGDTVGVFQCESSGARRTLRQLQVQSVQDLAVANAFFKPGPATGGMANHFVRRYRGEEPVTYLHPALAPILGPTKGVLIFQEQVLRVAHTVAGLSWLEADALRKGMSKFEAETMAQMRNRFVEGCQRPAPAGPAFTPEQAATLWEQVLAFAGYGFNQGHATAYADVSYRSAWLKAHYPAAFLVARLAHAGGFHHPAIYLAEAQRLGIPVSPPHINHSRRHFRMTLTGEEGDAPLLWMGLGQVRSLRRSTIAAILAQRKVRPFASLADLRARVALQQKELIHLIQGGALDGLGESRMALLEAAQVKRQTASAWQLTFAFSAPATPAESPAQRLQWERQVLGLPVSVHPVDLIDATTHASTLTQASDHPGRRMRLAVTRLPGWTGGKGFFVSDGTTYAVAIPTSKLPAPRPWVPLLLTGRWVVDEWGGGTLQAEGWDAIESVN
ncbi:MAG: DNA polymerase III subunit alpha [Caldilineaceae bacterium]|nr:DNA polymerase III subunit alpha [Caldilineaceae bacterium]